MSSTIAFHGVRGAIRPWLILSVLVGLLACQASLRADIKVTFDLKDGDKISDIAKVVAHVESSSDINKVEFAVDDQPKKTVTSVPYTYEWDTYADREGTHTLTATATDANGQSKAARLSLTVDNGLDAGAPALAQKAQDALAAGNRETAMHYARRALKAEPTNGVGSRALAALYAQDGDLSKAIETLANAKIDALPEGMLDLAAYRLRRALMVENASSFYTEYVKVSGLRRKATDLAVKSTRSQVEKPGSLAAHTMVGDALLSAGHFNDAFLEYQSAIKGDKAPAEIVARVALANVLDGHAKEAISQLKGLTVDPASRAVMGLALLDQRRFDEARRVVANDIVNHVPAALVVGAFADSALNNPSAAFMEAQEAISLIPTAGEAQFALSLVTPDINDSRRALALALALSPFQTGPVLDYATRITLIDRADRIETPLKLVNFVLQSEPNNTEAKLLQTMLLIQSGKVADVKPILRDLNKNEPGAPDVLLATAVYANKVHAEDDTRRYTEQARKADSIRFDFASPPTPLEYIQLLNHRLFYRPNAYLTPGTLFPPKRAETPKKAAAVANP